MSADTPPPPEGTTLSRITDFAKTNHEFVVPSKKINDGDDLEFFFSTSAYRGLTLWLVQLTRAVFPKKNADGTLTQWTPESVGGLPISIQHLQCLLQELTRYIEQAPPDRGPRRYGNVAFRKWFELAEANMIDLLRSCFLQSGHIKAASSAQEDALLEELKTYLLGGFGSAPRLDYGTGHELSYLAFLACLWKLGVFNDGDEQAIVLHVIIPYLELVRKLILTYTLEPAGSHGVWGLDDYSFLPYIFGSAQLGPGLSPGDYTSPLPVEGSFDQKIHPALITDRLAVSRLQSTNMYFAAIQFIYDTKKGPFGEHSPVLYDISGIKDGWGKVNKGMLKMYAGEVLSKFPIMQHFPFGSMFKWERDPNAPAPHPTLHTQQQPSAVKFHGHPPPQAPQAPPAVGTSAPWARPNTGSSQIPQIPQTQAATGLPTSRALRMGGVDARTSMGSPTPRRPPPADDQGTKPR